MATPATIDITADLQDNRGFRASTKVVTWDPDMEVDTTVVSDVFTFSHNLAAAIAAMSNAKLVGVTVSYRFDIAQEPSSETGTYELVTQKARLEGGDGAGAYMSASIPAPKDTIFLSSGQDNLIVVDPGDSLVTAFQTACAGLPATPRGGSPFALFFGGQLVQGKPRRRRVLQGG